MRLLVGKASVLMTIQDGGRFGFQRFGVPESGPMDWWAFRAANHLVDNHPQQACVEIGFSSAELIMEGEDLIAACGAGYQLFINGRNMPLWMAIWVKHGDKLSLEKVPGGNWVYLGISGGIQTKAWMGSRSFYARARLGQKIYVSKALPLSENHQGDRSRAGAQFDNNAYPAYGRDPVVRIILGPHQDRFTSESMADLCSGSYRVSPRSDRMGYRLQGQTLLHNKGADLVSQGMALGEIQIPADGQPLVMMPDHPTTGGYTCIGTVAKVDLPLLAQAEFGLATIQFQLIEVKPAQSALVNALDALRNGLQTEEDAWQHL
ncbi:MAG: biotin-dependent carboxyltransferase family protein [Anaerolineales bacterium]